MEGFAAPPDVIADVELIMKTAGIEVGGVEYIIDERDGQPIVPTTTDGNGNVIVQTQGTAGLYVFSPMLRTVHNDYNDSGELADSIDQYGNETSYIYNSNGQVTETNYPDGTEVKTVYDAQGRTIWTTNKFNPANSTADIIACNSLVTEPVADDPAVICEPVTVDAIDVPGVLPFGGLQREVESLPQSREMYSS